MTIRLHDPDRLRSFLLSDALDPFVVLAFTSCSSISTFSRALCSSSVQRPLSDTASTLPFTVATLGSNTDLLDGVFLTKLCDDARRIAVLILDVPTPAGLVEALGRGSNRSVLYLIPDVVSPREPPVIPDFLTGLEAAGWVAVRAAAYTTCWVGPGCAELLVAEVEGLLKGVDASGWSWPRLRAWWPEMVVAAHRPVTADDVRGFGIEVDIMSSKFSSFHGVLDALVAVFCSKNIV